MTAKTEEKKFTVVIDAGHGGKDIGATDNGVMEKNINLKVAKQLETLIKKKLKNTTVVMTRDGDTYLTLQQRADKANAAKGDLFISIHTNSVDKKNKNRKNLSGSSVYTLGLNKDDNNLEVAQRENSVIELEQDFEQKYSGFDPRKDESYIIFEMAQKKNLSRSIKFAESVEKELVKSGRKDRGVHQAGFWVLWATSMPSVLVELDFICNPESAAYLASDKGSKELAESIFKALQDYESSWRKSNGAIKGGDLSDTYIEDSTGNLEDTYFEVSSAPYAVGRKRNHKSSESSSKTLVGSHSTDNGLRRRRSARSKELSESKSYEQSDLVFSGNKLYASVTETDDIDEKPLILNETTSKDKTKGNKKKTDKKKQNIEKSKSKRRNDSYNAKVNKLVTVYKIQILASTDLLSQGNSRFCGLSPVSAFKENNLYKYYYGESTDKSEMEALLADVKKKIPDAFIVKSQKTIQKNK